MPAFNNTPPPPFPPPSRERVGESLKAVSASEPAPELCRAARPDVGMVWPRGEFAPSILERPLEAYGRELGASLGIGGTGPIGPRRSAWTMKSGRQRPEARRPRTATASAASVVFPINPPPARAKPPPSRAGSDRTANRVPASDSSTAPPEACVSAEASAAPPISASTEEAGPPGPASGSTFPRSRRAASRQRQKKPPLGRFSSGIFLGIGGLAPELARGLISGGLSRRPRWRFLRLKRQPLMLLCHRDADRRNGVDKSYRGADIAEGAAKRGQPSPRD